VGQPLATSWVSPTAPPPVRPLRIAMASFIGTAVEWYDYFIYGTAAAIVFGPLFFPKFSATAGTMAAFATFSVGFLARPSARSSWVTSATASDASRSCFFPPWPATAGLLLPPLDVHTHHEEPQGQRSFPEGAGGHDVRDEIACEWRRKETRKTEGQPTQSTITAVLMLVSPCTSD
jgi:hypothetical protein